MYEITLKHRLESKQKECTSINLVDTNQLKAGIAIPSQTKQMLRLNTTYK